MVEDPYADTGGNEEEALTGVINIYFPDMKKWIFEYLSKVAEEVCVLVCVLIVSHMISLGLGCGCEAHGGQYATGESVGSAGVTGKVWLL